MILSNFSLDEQKRIRFVHVVDVYNDEKWVKQVKSLVNGVIEPNSKVGLIGHFKDESSYYLRLFPEWVMVELDNKKIRFLPLQCVKPTIRAKLKRMHFPRHHSILEEFQNTPLYLQLQQKFLQADHSNIEETVSSHKNDSI